MILRYNLTEEDYLAYNQHLHYGAPAKQKYWGKFRVLFFAVFSLLGLILWRLNGEIIPFVFFTVTGGVIAAILPKLLRRSLEKRVRKLLDETRNTVLLGEREILFTDDTLTLKGVQIETTVRWEAFGNFEETDGYYYLYVTGTSAFIFPKRIFEHAQQKQQFLEIMKEKVLQSHT